MKGLPEPVPVLGVGIHPITNKNLVDTLCRWATETGSQRVYHVNVHAMNLSCESPAFRKSLNTADLVFCDGFGVKWAARLLGHDLPARMTPPDWIDEFLSRLPSGHTIYLLGDREDVVEAAANLMQTRHPHLCLIGHHHGFFDPDGADNQEVVDAINASDAKVLLVGMGMPRQEFWIDDNLGDLKVSLAITAGAMFRYYSGADWRPPRWVTDRGLEWVFRLARDPRRLFKRYVFGNLRFIFRAARAGMAGQDP